MCSACLSSGCGSFQPVSTDELTAQAQRLHPPPRASPFRASRPALPHRRLPRAPWRHRSTSITPGSSPAGPGTHDPRVPLTPGRVICEFSRRVVPAGYSGMGLSPAASGEFGIRLSRVPWPRRKSISRTSSTGSSDTQPATGQLAVPHSGLPRERGLSLEAFLGGESPPVRNGLTVILTLGSPHFCPLQILWRAKQEPGTVLILFYCSFWRQGLSCYASQDGLEFRLVWNSQLCAYLGLQSIGIRGIHHHTWL